MIDSNVLVVDDSKTINSFIANILSENNINNVSAFDAEEAWSLLETNRFDLILLDVVLPDSNGFQLCKKIKATEYLKDIPVIFLTGLVDKDNIVHAFDLGAADYIIKPFDRAELLARVKNHLDLVHIKFHLQEEVKEHQIKAIALKESEQNYKLLFDNMTNGFTVSQIIYKDNKVFDFEIIAANEAFEEISGFRKNNLIGNTIKNILPDITNDLFTNFTNAALSGEKQKIHFFSKKLNKYLNISIFSPKHEQFAAVFEDITQQKTAEIELQNSEKKHREFNATKDKFFSIIAHDLRSPFSSIIGLSEMMANDEDIDLKQLKEFSKMIFQTSFKTFELIENLLSWAKSQTGNISNNPREVQLFMIVTDIFNMLSEKARFKNIKFINKIKSDTIIFADKDMLNTILRNLINNAVNYTNNNGEICVNFLKDGSNAIITVEDNGIGIEKEHLENLFRIDYNKISIGNSIEKGNGLGLIICKEFIDKMEGQIEVVSELNVGSKFTLNLPNAIR